MLHMSLRRFRIRTPSFRILHAGAERGFSLIETLAALGLGMVITYIAAAQLKDYDNPLQNGAAQLQGFLKQVRAEAISSTSAYIIRPSSATHLETLVGTRCTDAAPVLDSRVALDLPNGASFTSTTWFFCFSARGFPDANIEIQLHDLGGATKNVEVLLGGAVRIL